jgi:DNA-binding response OmpR family regulator
MAKNKILLIDDTKMVQQIYKSKLMLDGFQVITADNGMEGIKLLSEDPPDLILLDLNMPVLDGYKVLQVVKTNPKLSSIPVIIFSAKGQPEEIEKALNLGADGYLVKATTKPQDVVAKVKKLLSKRPESKEVTHYKIQIKKDLYDASRLAEDFNMQNFLCRRCNGPMFLELIPDFSHETPWFSGRFFCPSCHK